MPKRALHVRESGCNLLQPCGSQDAQHSVWWDALACRMGEARGPGMQHQAIGPLVGPSRTPSTHSLPALLSHRARAPPSPPHAHAQMRNEEMGEKMDRRQASYMRREDEMRAEITELQVGGPAGAAGRPACARHWRGRGGLRGEPVATRSRPTSCTPARPRCRPTPLPACLPPASTLPVPSAAVQAPPAHAPTQHINLPVLGPTCAHRPQHTAPRAPAQRRA